MTIRIVGIALSLSLSAGFVTSSAMAADILEPLPSYENVAAEPYTGHAPSFTWTGPWVGANAGAAWSAGRLRSVAFGSDIWVPFDGSNGDAGLTVGAGIGYNYQIGSFVIGLATDIGYVDGKRTRSAGYDASWFHAFDGLRHVSAANDVPFSAVGYTSVESGVDWLGTVRGRLGYAADRFFVYGTGGLAYGGATLKTSSSVSGQVGSESFDGWWNSAGGGNKTRVGWTLGGGFEYAVSSNVTANLEYLYYDLGRERSYLYPVSGVANDVGVAGGVRAEYDGSLVRAGLSYKW